MVLKLVMVLLRNVKNWQKLRIPNIVGTKPFNYNMCAIQKSIFEIVNWQKPQS